MTSVQSTVRMAAQELMESPTEKDMVAFLSKFDIGIRPKDEQFSAAQTAMEELKSSGSVKTFNVRIVDKDGSRLVTIGWSKLLDFPSQTFTIPVSSLTKDCQRIRDVMDS